MKQHRFTLMEMLVVVGVIAVLAGLLLPALAHSRDAGLRTKCLNNHQQIIRAQGVYAGENGGHMIMKNRGKNAPDGEGYTYATVLNGIDEGSGTNDYRTKSYVPKEALVCPISKEVLVSSYEAKHISTPRNKYIGENAIGILNPIHLSSGKRDASVTSETGTGNDCWIGCQVEKHGTGPHLRYYQTMGRFVNVPENDNYTVTFMTDRMKNPAELVIFADTFRKGGRGSNTDSFETFWLFSPRYKTEGRDGDYYAATAHQDRCSTAFADGHAEAMDAGRLRDCSTEIIKFLGSDLERHPSSDGL